MKESLKFIYAVLGLVGALSMVAGCAGRLAEFNSVVGSPSATQAVANLKAGSAAILCTIAGLSNETSAIATAVDAKQAIIRDSQTAYVISGSLCLQLGGTVGATTVVPAN